MRKDDTVSRGRDHLVQKGHGTDKFVPAKRKLGASMKPGTKARKAEKTESNSDKKTQERSFQVGKVKVGKVKLMKCLIDNRC